MPAAVRVLVFAGSLRTGSFNKKLARIGAEAALRAGAEVTLLDLRDHAMPLYDGDLEASQGLPAPAVAFKQQLIAHEAFLLACPEYNSSIIDWASRPAPGEAQLVAFRGKTAALMSASPGALGGLRGLVTVRSILGNIGTLVLADQVTVPLAHEAFADDGSLKDAKRQAAVEKLAAALVDLARRRKD
jgi:NAD(P)H-dependent FMN reductase